MKEKYKPLIEKTDEEIKIATGIFWGKAKKGELDLDAFHTAYDKELKKASFNFGYTFELNGDFKRDILWDDILTYQPEDKYKSALWALRKVYSLWLKNRKK